MPGRVRVQRRQPAADLRVKDARLAVGGGGVRVPPRAAIPSRIAQASWLPASASVQRSRTSSAHADGRGPAPTMSPRHQGSSTRRAAMSSSTASRASRSACTSANTPILTAAVSRCPGGGSQASAREGPSGSSSSLLRHPPAVRQRDPVVPRDADPHGAQLPIGRVGEVHRHRRQQRGVDSGRHASRARRGFLEQPLPGASVAPEQLIRRPRAIGDRLGADAAASPRLGRRADDQVGVIGVRAA